MLFLYFALLPLISPPPFSPLLSLRHAATAGLIFIVFFFADIACTPFRHAAFADAASRSLMPFFISCHEVFFYASFADTPFSPATASAAADFSPLIRVI